MRPLAIAVASALLLAGCATSDGREGPAREVLLPADATIEYDFQDSSVPPPYHRSYVLTVTEAESRIVVDSYGDVLADESVETSPDVWQQLNDGYPELAGLSLSPQADGCTGGTAFDLTVTQPTETLVDMRVDLCGGTNDAADELVRAWLAPARAQFPAMDVLAPEGE